MTSQVQQAVDHHRGLLGPGVRHWRRFVALRRPGCVERRRGVGPLAASGVGVLGGVRLVELTGRRNHVLRSLSPVPLEGLESLARQIRRNAVLR